MTLYFSRRFSAMSDVRCQMSGRAFSVLFSAELFGEVRKNHYLCTVKVKGLMLKREALDANAIPTSGKPEKGWTQVPETRDATAPKTKRNVKPS